MTILDSGMSLDDALAEGSPSVPAPEPLDIRLSVKDKVSDAVAYSRSKSSYEELPCREVRALYGPGESEVDCMASVPMGESRASRRKRTPTIRSRCSSEGKTLLRAIKKHEGGMLEAANHLHLVLLASILLERELGHLLAAPAMGVLPSILDSQRTYSKGYKTEALEGWGEGKVQMTLGIEIMILCGLRWGLDQRRTEILEFVNEYFEAEYLHLAGSAELTASLDTVREDFRNPAHHGARVEFTGEDYAGLCRLITGKGSFRSWTRNPGPVCESNIGLLHNHLLLARATSPDDDVY